MTPLRSMKSVQYTLLSFLILSALIIYQVTIVGNHVEQNNTDTPSQSQQPHSRIKTSPSQHNENPQTHERITPKASSSTTATKPNTNTTQSSSSISYGFRGTFTNDATKPFNSHNPHQLTWCPNATCTNSPICHPCDRRYILILATARSGSTTLLRMFGSLPNVRLAGENINTLKKMYDVQWNLVSGSQNGPVMKANGRGRASGPFARHPIPVGSYACPTQQFLNALNPPSHNAMLRAKSPKVLEEEDRDTILGFKSVRFHLGDWTVQQGATFLKENFPCSKVVLNIRSNVDNQISSVGTNFIKSGRTRDELIEYNSFQMALADELGEDMARLIDMNDWKEDVSVLNDVIKWMGFKGCAFQELVHENHDGYGRDTEHKVDLGKNCWYPYKKQEPIET